MSPTRTDDSQRRTLSAVVGLSTVLLGGLLIVHARTFAWQRLDDAFVLLRYATNAHSGQGWVFNPGERVDAFTSPALVALESAALGLGMQGLTFAHLLGLCSGLLVMLAAMRMCRVLGGSAATQILSAAAAALSTPLAMSCENGLETAPFSAAVSWGLAVCVGRSRQDRVLAGLLLGVAVAFRPDGVFAFACAFFASDVRWPSDERPRWQWLDRAVPFSAVVVPLMVWHRLYFGAVAGNSFLAHSAPHAENRWSSGITYLLGALATPASMAGLAGLGALAWRASAARLYLAFCFLWCAYVTAGGGEHASGRPIVPLVPFLAAGAGAGLEELTAWTARHRPGTLSWKPAATFALMVLIAAGGRVESGEVVQRRASPDPIEHARASLGAWLRKAARPADSLAIYGVGQVGYESGLVMVGTDGLTDPAIARMLHASPGMYRDHVFFPQTEALDRVARAVLARHPDLIATVSTVPDADLEDQRASVEDGAIERNEAFKSGYAPYCSLTDYVHFDLFLRKGYVPRLTGTPHSGRRTCD